jgi:hypothetical protein
MSCVLGNRVIINVRQVNKEMEREKRTRTRRTGESSSVRKSIAQVQVVDSDTLTDIEMAQLRSMQVDYYHIQEYCAE